MKLLGKIIPPFITVHHIRNRQAYKKMLETRKGECKKCGACCKGCFFEGKNRCKIELIRPIACRLYPTIVDGLKLHNGCGFYWDKKDKEWAEKWLKKHYKIADEWLREQNEMIKATIKKSKVSIVVLNYNGEEVISRCLESCINIKFPKDSFEVIVVDNNSSDNSCAIVERDFPDVKIIKNKKNYGTGGFNTVIGRTTGNYLFFLNNDNVLFPDCVSKLIEAISKSNETGLCEAKELNFNDKNRIESAGTWVSRAFYCNYIKKINHPERIKEVPYVGGAFIKKEVLDELGYLFDPDFFLYAEDLDLGLRARLIGRKTLYVPGAVMYHMESATTKKEFSMPHIIFLMERNLLTTFFKITGMPRLFLYSPYVFAMRFFAILKDLISLRPSYSIARVKAILWIIANTGKIMQKRKETQKTRQMGDRYVFRPFTERKLFGL